MLNSLRRLVSLSWSTFILVTMKLLALCVVLAMAQAARKPVTTKAPPTLESVVDQMNELKKTVEQMTGTIGTLSRQLMLQQLNMEERIRSEGDSGIKQIRVSSGGTKPYHAPSYVGSRFLSVHDHANNYRTIGMGEFIAVLNGVEFRTRHNDYGLRMPHRTSTAYHAVEDVPFPEVPPAVLKKATVQEQITEMREWFKAWANQDYSKRDYRPYFKPTLCYLEGAWTTNSKSLDEPFSSDRHHIDATSWFDLQEKIRFTSYTGRKSSLENYAYLPTTVMNLLNGTIPQVAQWNYRIACHPLKRDLPLNRLRVVDDLAARMSYKRRIGLHSMSRAARFQINPRDSNTWSERTSSYGLLDQLMEEIPGKNNYAGNLTDDAFESTAYEYYAKDSKPINVAYYHRYFRTTDKDAMGTSSQHRGYADTNIFMAMTTQPQVAPMTVKSCKRRVCKTYTQRWTYAVPLEVIYMTPLYRWNPYDIEFKGKTGSKEARVVTYAGRNGGIEKDRAFNGTASKYYYQTPAEFFSGTTTEKDSADTSKGIVGVLDKNGDVRRVTSSGTKIVLPEIEGIGRLRTRYPVMPIHAEGQATWKELSALKDLVMEQPRYLSMYNELPVGVNSVMLSNLNKTVASDMLLETSTPSGNEHTHTIRLSAEDIEELKQGKYMFVVTSESMGHSHSLRLKAYKRRNKWVYYFDICDGTGTKKCWDGHRRILYIIEGQDLDA
ncbi:uncharacterized protein LOC106153767 [Lingula anatina]|uniref:Uncharacterized protein LOC106153767 n=1 Tax=Lingula anatina TaxID=7574 RepID=A0A1S3HBC7_LINAN|nr:uncharacterized protein LOC106153767 [Lingula anatina]|eukprot:XP_013383323.1 uncharacterized protein LOC106153767 [Lingula anatina]